MVVAVRVKGPDEEASAILRGVWLPLSPRLIPVDPVRIANELGIDVFEAALDPNTSGAIIKRPGEDPQIVLNRNDHANRQRFTCAHEIGHFVQRSDEPDDYEFVDLRGPLASAGTDSVERYANAFAAALLMPAEEVKTRAKRADSIVELAYEFRVSQDAMTNRLANLKVGFARS